MTVHLQHSIRMYLQFVRNAAVIPFLFLMAPAANAEILFSESMDGTFPYSFDGYRFGYTNDPIETYHEATGGADGGANHRIPLGGPSRTNFDVHFAESFPNGLMDYNVRFYLKVNETFNTNPGENWKLTYNYLDDGASGNFVFWLRPRTPYGFEPAVFSTYHGGSVFKTENIPTFYLEDFKNQWICFEYRMDIPNQHLWVWITAEDGSYQQTLYIDAHFAEPPTPVDLIKVGAYWDGQGDDNHFRLDEVVVADQYIGPLGHEGDAPPSAPPDVTAD